MTKIETVTEETDAETAREALKYVFRVIDAHNEYMGRTFNPTGKLNEHILTVKDGAKIKSLADARATISLVQPSWVSVVLDGLESYANFLNGASRDDLMELNPNAVRKAREEIEHVFSRANSRPRSNPRPRAVNTMPKY